MDCNKKWCDAVGHAWDGFYFCLRRQWHMQVGFVIGALVMLAAWQLRFSPVEWAILLVTICLVLTLEMVNTALEAVVDLASPEYHSLAKIAKDVAAGAVFLACMASVGVAFCLFVLR